MTITEFLQAHHVLGLTIGLATFLTIGVFHPIVIKSEYYFGVRCWWWFLIIGIVCVALSALVWDVLWSTLLGVVGFSCFWSIKEIFEQEERVKKGWFPRNPKRKYRFDE
jgi:hypothetical protein